MSKTFIEMDNFSITKFYAGKDKGISYQITALCEDGLHHYFILTPSQILLLVSELSKELMEQFLSNLKKV